MFTKSHNYSLESLPTDVAGASARPSKENLAVVSEKPIATETDTIKRQFKKASLLGKFAIKTQKDETNRKNIYKNKPIFGSTLIELHKLSGRTVPEFVSKIIDIIEDPYNIKIEGIYRLSSNISSIQTVRSKIDSYKFDVLENYRNNITVLTGSHKLFYRELKEPLIGKNECAELIKIWESKPPNIYEKVEDVISKLHETHKDTIVALLEHLVKITRHEKDNRMSIPSMAVCWGPLLFQFDDMSKVALSIALVELLLNTYQNSFHHKQPIEAVSMISVRSEELEPHNSSQMRRFDSEWTLNDSSQTIAVKESFSNDLMVDIIDALKVKNINHIYNFKKYKPNKRTVAKILDKKNAQTRLQIKLLREASAVDLGECLLKLVKGSHAEIFPKNAEIITNLAKADTSITDEEIHGKLRIMIDNLPAERYPLLKKLFEHFKGLLERCSDQNAMLKCIVKSWAPTLYEQNQVITTKCFEGLIKIFNEDIEANVKK